MTAAETAAVPLAIVDGAGSLVKMEVEGVVMNLTVEREGLVLGMDPNGK